MYIVIATQYFNKKAKKLINKNTNILKLVTTAITKLSIDPKDISLKSHKVNTPKFGQVYSSAVTGDIRIIWLYDNNKILVINLIDIGGHGKVY